MIDSSDDAASLSSVDPIARDAHVCWDLISRGLQVGRSEVLSREKFPWWHLDSQSGGPT